MRTLLVATTNPGKLREIQRAMSDVPVRLASLADLPPIQEPEETGTTFEENARLKALYYAARSGLWTVAEDSGLVIDALGGEPGVRSARYLREDATYPERFADIYRTLFEFSRSFCEVFQRTVALVTVRLERREMLETTNQTL